MLPNDLRKTFPVISVKKFKFDKWTWSMKQVNLKNVKFRKTVTRNLTRKVAMNGKADACGSLQGQVV